MTESEAYRMLGWPMEGDILAFVLPATNSWSTLWVVLVCPKCSMRGISVPVDEVECVACGSPMVKIDWGTK